MTSTSLVGSTGLVGSYILSTLIAHPSISSIHTLSRRDPQPASPKLHPLTSPDSTTWSALLNAITPPPTLFFSSLGTTRAQAGSIDAQRKIDHDLNLALATTFAQAPAPKKIYILISTSGANPTSMIPYSRMKGELEDAVKALALGPDSPDEPRQPGLNHVIILRPGLIVGTRSDSPPARVCDAQGGRAGRLDQSRVEGLLGAGRRGDWEGGGERGLEGAGGEGRRECGSEGVGAGHGGYCEVGADGVEGGVGGGVGGGGGA
ncbi:hypothetical protein EYC84_009591 [Monilinia fructicola]|uniref:NAD(P)-binding domain-containing protein n=1 Tax=Monilinia fructicola TaxID=38448 RepID=A0A5M9JCY0_MONFR|nr:hypothetical protein EYC84_009591 [Monilinia fructicola]